MEVAYSYSGVTSFISEFKQDSNWYRPNESLNNQLPIDYLKADAHL